MTILTDLYTFMLDYRTGLIAASIVIIAFYILRAFGISYLKIITQKTATDIDDFFVDVLRTFHGVFALATAILTGFFVEGGVLADNPALFSFIVLVVVYQLIRIAGTFFEFISSRMRRVEEDAPFQGLKTIAQLFIWAIGLTFLLSQLGYDIAAILAGLGVGGIAVALALQNILSDVFSSFSIYFDKPFKVGDFIVAGDRFGTVERVGMKTTRIRSLQGEEIIMSNRFLTDNTVQNYHRMQSRRVVHHLGFAYHTPSKVFETLQEEIKTIVESTEDTVFDRAHFQSFGDSSLVWELVYFVESGSYNVYAEREHAINMKLKAHFEAKKIEIAFPTQTIHVKKG